MEEYMKLKRSDNINNQQNQLNPAKESGVYFNSMSNGQDSEIIRNIMSFLKFDGTHQKSEIIPRIHDILTDLQIANRVEDKVKKILGI